MKKQNILIVGSGLYGAVFAHEAAKHGNKVTVIEKDNHVAGHIYTEEIDGIQVHKYGAHIFHTSNKKVWDYIQQFAEFNRYTNSPVANYKGHMYNLPFNMNTFSEMWGVRTPQEAMDKINEQRKEMEGKEPQNLEEQAISLIGRDIYEKLIKGYTEKQWGRKATDLPPFIIKRLPVRLTYDNNYFNDDYQGIPKGGYTQIIEKMLDNPNITVKLNTDFFDKKNEYLKSFDKIVYTGPIDQFFDYKLGRLEYRSLKFETEEKNVGNYQGNAVINYTEAEVPYTRIIEHKHFEFGKGDKNKTIITREYPAEWQPGDEPYYPVNNDKNNELYAKYKELADKENKVIFGGRLGQYKYFNMDQVIEAALQVIEEKFVHTSMKRKMKIAIFASDNCQGSGAFRSMVTLSKLLQENYNVAVKIYLPQKGDGEELLRKNNLDYVIIPSFNWIVGLKNYRSIRKKAQWKIKQLINIYSEKCVREDLIKFKPDVVHNNTSYGYIGVKAANKLGIPVVWHIREFLEEDQFTRFWDKEKAYKLFNKADRIIAISEAINKKYKPFFGSKIQTVYNGIDETLYNSNHELLPGRMNLLTVGGLYSGKGHSLIIKALGILKKEGITNFKYRIVGKGEEEEKLKILSKRENLQDNVEFCGFYKNPQPYYQISDIFILGSVSEAFGRVTVEAMMNGLITIGRNSAATAEILKDGEYGLLFENKYELAKKLKKLLKNKEKAVKLAKLGRKHAICNYTATKNAAEIYKVYQEILNKN